jgi:cyclopropane fatty-acyl-phospholipid synthase-like methyltransferase
MVEGLAAAGKRPDPPKFSSARGFKLENTCHWQCDSKLNLLEPLNCDRKESLANMRPWLTLAAIVAAIAAAISVQPYVQEFISALRVIAAADSAEKLYSTVMQSWRVVLCDDGAGWLNIGLWESPNVTYGEAAKALALRVTRGLPWSPGDVVLDVGCGEGDATLIWASEARSAALELGRNVEPAKLVGINLAAPQLAAAAARAAALGATNVDFVRANALTLPHGTESVAAMIALESAFHFSPSRRAFFTEAFRVLRRGGQLRMSDIICAPAARALRGMWAASWLSNLLNIPPENQVSDAGRPTV